MSLLFFPYGKFFFSSLLPITRVHTRTDGQTDRQTDGRRTKVGPEDVKRPENWKFFRNSKVKENEYYYTFCSKVKILHFGCERNF